MKATIMLASVVCDAVMKTVMMKHAIRHYVHVAGERYCMRRMHGAADVCHVITVHSMVGNCDEWTDTVVASNNGCDDKNVLEQQSTALFVPVKAGWSAVSTQSVPALNRPPDDRVWPAATSGGTKAACGCRQAALAGGHNSSPSRGAVHCH